jgi:hypothetical protein
MRHVAEQLLFGVEFGYRNRGSYTVSSDHLDDHWCQGRSREGCIGATRGMERGSIIVTRFGRAIVALIPQCRVNITRA